MWLCSFALFGVLFHRFIVVFLGFADCSTLPHFDPQKFPFDTSPRNTGYNTYCKMCHCLTTAGLRPVPEADEMADNVTTVTHKKVRLQNAFCITNAHLATCPPMLNNSPRLSIPKLAIIGGRWERLTARHLFPIC
ncbi:MAG: hypothetical protein II284_03125 [Clostridia bacterium]|nr:hypothetical protein [Clostridia bacterium]